MSIIRAQAFRFSLVNYFATLIAAVSTLWIYPLEISTYGLAQFLVSFATLCIPLATFGTLTLIVKFFPEYKALGLQKSYLFNILILGFGSLIVTASVAVLINRPVLKFLEFLSFDAYLIAKHKYAIVAFIAIMLYNNVLIVHSSNYNKIAVPSAFQNLLPKLTLPLLIIGVYLDLFDAATFARLWVLSFGLASIGLTLYLKHIDALDLQPQLHFFRKDRLRRMLGYSGYMGAGTMAGLMVGKIDLIMVGTLLGLKETGIYGIALFIGNVLMIPAMAVWQISSPIISQAFEKQDWPRITEVYKKSSANLLVVGIFMYFLILGILDTVLTLSPNYHDIIMIVPLFAIIGITKMIEMGASVNQYILMFSSRYRSVLFFVVFMALVNIVLNYLLIGVLGILGAAISTCITAYLYQFVKCFYIQRQFRIHPLSKMTPRILILFVLVMLYHLLLPEIAPPTIQAIVYCAGLLVVYITAVRLLKIQTDATDTAEKYLNVILSRMRRSI